jgi:sucrose-6-phosphate hydrolase SacC (GH32 family)
VLQQQKVQQHVYALGSHDSAVHKFISVNPKLDFCWFESSWYDYGRVYASDSFFNPVNQRHIVLSWVNETDMEELEL